MNDLKIAIIGAGNLSTKRIYPYIGAAGAYLVGVCDLDQERAETNARRFGGHAYTNWEQMLQKEKPDGVLVCINPAMHYQLAKALLQLGYPVYTEKPPAESAEDAWEIAQLAHQTGGMCTTAFKKRYALPYVRAKTWLHQFDSSQYYSISLDYASSQYDNQTLHRSFLFDFGIHAIDLLPYLFGEVEAVHCFAKGADAYAVSLRFQNQAVGSMNLTDGRSFELPTEEMELTVQGGNFMRIHNSSCWQIAENGNAVEWREPPTFVSGGDSGNNTGHLAELVDFIQAIQEQRTTRSNIYESYKSMVLYEAILQSATSQSRIDITYQPLD
jgi:predicted dehydrogenase